MRLLILCLIPQIHHKIQAKYQHHRIQILNNHNHRAQKHNNHQLHRKIQLNNLIRINRKQLKVRFQNLHGHQISIY